MFTMIPDGKPVSLMESWVASCYEFI